MPTKPPPSPPEPTPEADPVDPPTPGGLRHPLTPEASPQADERIGTHGELFLPDVVPIARAGHAGRMLCWLNEQWIQVHYFARGVAGTGVEWYLFFAGVLMQNPKLGVALLAFAAITAEEKWATQPIFTNLIKYGMHALDPEAAEIVFASRPVEPDPIGKAAALATEEATKAYMDSADYRLLKAYIEADVSRQIRRQAYVAAGMPEDVAAVDEEIADARETRAAKRVSAQPTAARVESVGPDPFYKQGASIDREAAPEAEAAEPEEAAPDPEAEPAPEDAAAAAVDAVKAALGPLGKPPHKRAKGAKGEP